MKILFPLLIGLFLGCARAQEQWPITCQFLIAGPDYECFVVGGFLPDNENVNVVIQGQHQPGRSNSDVTRVRISTSFFSFIVRAFFDEFVNMNFYEYTNSQHPLRIQQNAFFNTPNLRTIAITSTPLSVVGNNAFMGASNLETLNLVSNQIQTIPQFMFSGVTTLINIDLRGNNISTISDTVLRQQTYLQHFSIAGNQLTRIPGNLVLTNVNLLLFDASFNQINELGRRFLDPVTQLHTLDLRSNLCINNQWNNIGGAGGPSKDNIRQEMDTCFNNYGGPLEEKEFIFELRGNLRLYDEYGNFIISL